MTFGHHRGGEQDTPVGRHGHTDVLVVGAGLGGLRTVEGLRARGFRGSITLVGDEAHLPYDRPPLTKEVLRGERDSTVLRNDIDLLGIDLRLRTHARRLDTDSKVVELDDGLRLSYDIAVLAPGGEARRLPDVEDAASLHLVRTIDDALALRAAIANGGTVTVVGSGFIGCEVAAVASARGVSVNLVDLLPTPMARVLGQVGGEIVASLHREHGVRLFTGSRVAAARCEPAVEVVLDSGVVLASDHVVLGLGIDPRTEWLAGSGVVVRDGIRCEATGRTSAPDVFAVGDAAQWWHPLANGYRRVEHWSTTVDQARVVAANIMADGGTSSTLTDPPYFWSDQFGVKIQSIGFIDPHDDVDTVKSEGSTVLLYSRKGRLSGAVGFNAARQVGRMRTSVAAGALVADARTSLTR